MPEKPEKFYSRGAEKFAENNSIENLSDRFVDFIDSFIEEVGEGRVLDAGCGPGRDVEYFTENGLDAVGIDLAGGMIEYAKANKKGEYHIMDIRNLEFGDESFDGVYCNAVMHFFPPEKMKNVISELKRVLKPEGVLFLNFKLGEEDSILREKYNGEVKQYLLDQDQINQLLKEQNLKIIEKLEDNTIGGFEIINIICRKQE
ncbi:MAG: class I SAM-dependent methyltransferase [Candidatus Nanohalobium sp.]